MIAPEELKRLIKKKESIVSITTAGGER